MSILSALGIRVERLADLAPKFDPALAAEGRYIFVSNDDVSRMDLVTKWLERSFGLDTKSAALRMYAIHHHGSAVLGPYSPEEATLRFDLARTIASELGLHALEFSRHPLSDKKGPSA